MQRILPFALLAACLLAPPAPATGQAAPPSTPASAPAPAPQMVLVAVTRVRPGMAAEYEAFQKNDVVPMLKKAGVRWRDMWQTAAFGQTGEYTSVTPIDSMAQFDAPDMVVRVLGQEGARAYYAKVSSFIADRHTYALRTRPDLAHLPQPGATPRLAVITRGVVAAGRDAEFEDLLKNEVAPAFARAVAARTGVTGFMVGQTGFGGNQREYVTLSLEDNFASIAKGWPPSRVLGPEAGGQLARRIGATMTTIERSVARYNAELSFSPARTVSR